MSAAVPTLTLEQAEGALEAAQLAEREASDALQAAERAVLEAREAFGVAPSEELETAVEDAEREHRRAKRFAEARAAARELAVTTFQDAKARAGAKRLEQCRSERSSIRKELRGAFENVAGLAATLDDYVTAIEDLLDRDRVLAAEIGEPLIEPEIVRLALGHRLARDFELPEAPDRGRVDATAFERALGIVDGPGTLANQRDRLRSAHNEMRLLVGAELADWLRIEGPSSCAWDDYSPSGQRSREALRLLEDIEKETES